MELLIVVFVQELVDVAAGLVLHEPALHFFQAARVVAADVHHRHRANGSDGDGHDAVGQPDLPHARVVPD